MSQPLPPVFTFDRTAFSVGRLKDDDSQVDYWLAQPPERRLQAVEFLRGGHANHAGIRREFHRVLAVVKRA